MQRQVAVEYLTGDKTPNPNRPIELRISRNEAILLLNLLLARSDLLAASIAKAAYPDTEAGHLTKYCDARYLRELRELSDRIDERI